MKRWEEFEGSTPRAPRFALEFPLQYRTGDETTWRRGRSANISRSGVLFLAESPLHPETSIEVSFVVPVRIPGEPPASVICHGHVARQAVVDDSHDRVAIAATIEAYRFRRQTQVATCN